MYPTAITASLSYFRSQNPLLRRNVIILLTEILLYTQTSDSESLAEETLTEVVTGIEGEEAGIDEIGEIVIEEGKDYKHIV